MKKTEVLPAEARINFSQPAAAFNRPALDLNPKQPILGHQNLAQDSSDELESETNENLPAAAVSRPQ